MTVTFSNTNSSKKEGLKLDRKTKKNIESTDKKNDNESPENEKKEKSHGEMINNKEGTEEKKDVSEANSKKVKKQGKKKKKQHETRKKKLAASLYKPETYDPCVHLHFKLEHIDRECLTHDQYLEMLATPRGYRWAGEVDCTNPELEINKPRKKGLKRRKKIARRPETGDGEEEVETIWDVVTPEVTGRLIDFLVNEFGMSLEEAEDFIGCIKQTCIVKQPISKKKKIKQKTLKYKWVKEYSQVLSEKIERYINIMLRKKRTSRVQKIADVIVERFCDLTGENIPIGKPKKKSHKIMVHIADRLALWIDDIYKAERKKKLQEEEIPESELEEEEEEGEEEEEKEKDEGKAKEKPKKEKKEEEGGEEEEDEDEDKEEDKRADTVGNQPEKDEEEEQKKEEKKQSEKGEEKEPEKEEKEPEKEEKEPVKEKEKEPEKEEKPEEKEEKEPEKEEEPKPKEEEKEVEKEEKPQETEETPAEEEKPEEAVEEEEAEEGEEEEDGAEEEGGEEAEEEGAEAEEEEITEEQPLLEEKPEEIKPKTPEEKRRPVIPPRKSPGFAFEVKPKTGSTLQVQKLSSGTVVEVTAKVRGVEVPSRGRKVPMSESPLNLKSAEDWAEWAENIANVADEWGKWLENRLTDAEKQLLEKRRSRSDWKAWRDQAHTEALKWRVEEERIKDEAEMWGRKIDEKIKNKSETEVRTTDLS